MDDFCPFPTNAKWLDQMTKMPPGIPSDWSNRRGEERNPTKFAPSLLSFLINSLWAVSMINNEVST